MVSGCSGYRHPLGYSSGARQHIQGRTEFPTGRNGVAIVSTTTFQKDYRDQRGGRGPRASKCESMYGYVYEVVKGLLATRAP